MKKVAIFDVDGTIFRSSLIIELVETLIEEGIFLESARKGYDREHKRWLDRKGSYQDYIDGIIRVFMKNIKGVYYGDLVNASRLVIEWHQDRVYRYTRDLIKDLIRKKYFLLAVSQSPWVILDDFCKNLGFHKVYGRIYEIGPEDRLTGNVVDEHLILNKANIVYRAIEKEKLTLKGSIGVGDTENDLPFLELVEYPICFNPNKKLYKHAKRMKWDVVVERKDVVYEL